MKVLITGGAGFIGSNIAEKLLKDGHSVVVIDNLSTGRKENIFPDVKFYKTDAQDKSIEDIFKKEKPDIVSHHSAQIDVRKSVADPIFDAYANIIGSINILENCVKFGVKKVVFASSGGVVYGEQKTFPASENHPNYPICPYGVAKLTVEHYLYYYHFVHKLPYICLRYANVYGPRQNPFGEAGVVAIFIQKMLNNEQVIINGDGEQTRDYIYIDDVVNANILAMNYPSSDIFNIGTGIETNVNQIFDELKRLTNYKLNKTYGHSKDGEQRRSVLECSKAKAMLNWMPKTTLIDGLTKTVEYFAIMQTK
jgi:UDP-glucose 4-epimerase